MDVCLLKHQWDGWEIKTIEEFSTINGVLEYETLKENPLARRVKLADLYHNSDLTRLDLNVDKIPPKYDVYKEAIKILEG